MGLKAVGNVNAKVELKMNNAEMTERRRERERREREGVEERGRKV